VICMTLSSFHQKRLRDLQKTSKLLSRASRALRMFTDLVVTGAPGERSVRMATKPTSTLYSTTSRICAIEVSAKYVINIPFIYYTIDKSVSCHIHQLCSQEAIFLSKNDMYSCARRHRGTSEDECK
jgi:hypothetical protein